VTDERNGNQPDPDLEPDKKGSSAEDDEGDE
jgi:hypothetical protein